MIPLDTEIDKDMQEYAALQQQIEELQEKAAKLQKRIRNRAADAIRNLMRKTGIQQDDLLNEKPSKPKQTRAMRYRHPDGREWSGIGRRPLWMGETGEQDYLIVKDDAS